MSEDLDQQLADAEKAATERAKARSLAVQRRRIEELELEAKFETELGPRGSAFEIVRTVEGPIVVKLNDVTFFKKFAASAKEEADVFAFVKTAIAHPSADKFSEITGRRGELLGVVGITLRGLHIGAEDVERGK